MGQKSTGMDKLLQSFYEYPGKGFSIRALSTITKLPKSTVHKYLNELKREGMVSKENRAVLSDIFRIKKIFFYVEKMFRIGLVDCLNGHLKASCIILFGSFSKGESVKESDIDIFVETTEEKTLNLTEFEKKLGHKIHLFAESDIKKLPDRLFNNIVNGVKLKGVFKVK